MEKVLKLYSYNGDGVGNTPFPSSDSQIEIYDFTYDAQRMGDAPTITASVKWGTCLDNVWQDNVFAEFNGEKYFLKQTPTSSYSNEDARYKHDLELVSERISLNDVFFYDVVATDVETDKPLSNSSKVTFFGNISEFVQRLNYSLQYAGLGYNVVIDDEGALSTEGKLMSFKDQFFSNVLQEMYNVYEIPYYFVGKTIHIGFGTGQIPTVFRYGVDDALLSITKENAESKIVNRCTGVGSSENLPYYYPNQTEKGTFTFKADESNTGIKTGDIFISSKTKYAENLSVEDTLEYVATPKDIFNGVLYKTGGVSYASYPSSGLLLNIAPNSTVEVDVRIEVKFAYNGVHELRLNFTRDGNAVYVADYVDIFELKSADGKYAGTMSATKDTSNTTTLLKSKRCQAGTYYVEFTMKLQHYSNASGGNDNRFQLWGTTNNESHKWARIRETSITEDKDQLYDIEELGLRLSSSPEQGDVISVVDNGRIITQNNLMPSIYRRTNGEERFYNAENNTHPTGELDDDGNPLYFNFENTYNGHNPKEQIVSFEDIKPTITGMTNADGLRMDMFSEFAYDENDSDETVEIDGSLQYKHPYFFGKLRKFDGEHGFNLFDHAIESGEMTISFTSGSCGGCQFVIAVSEDEQKNIVQVDENGNLKRDINGDVLCGKEHFQQSQTPQDRQNDTFNNEVWVALRKDDSTFGNLMPVGNLKPKACTKNNDGTYENDGDSFVITNIDLPLGYVTAAEERLEKEIIAYMANNNSEKFNFAIKFSRIYLAENPEILEQLNENATLLIEYNGKTYPLYVSSFRYKASATDALPEITVELTDTITIVENSVQNAINAVKQDILSRVGNIDWLKVGLQYFLRKDIDDATPNTLGVGNLNVVNAIKSNNFIGGLLGAGFYLGNNAPNNSHLVVDTAEIRKRLTFNSLEIKHVEHVGGELILSPAGAKIDRVGLNVGDTAYSFDGIIDMSVRLNTSTIVTDSISGIYWLVRQKRFAALKGGVYYALFAIDDIVNADNYMKNGSVRTDVQFICDGKYYVYDTTSAALVDFYRCYFKASEDEISVVNDFKVDDLVKCQTFNLSSEKQRYYWRRVVAVGADYIDLSTSDYDTSVANDVPMAGDNIVTMGNKSVVERQNVIVISSYDEYAPSITMYQGINDYILSEDNVPVRISPKLGNKFTGDLYIQQTTDDGHQTVTSLAEFLDDRISFSVNSVIYDKEYAKDTNPLATVADYYEIEIIDDANAEWKKGDIIDVEVGVRAHNTGRIDIEIFVEEATCYALSPNGDSIFHLDDPSGEDYDTTLSLSFTMTEDWGDEFNGYGYAYFGILTDSEIEINPVSIKKRSLQSKLKRTGIDIENGRITLDAQITTIKDGDKEIAVFKVNDEGKAVINTEIIDADTIKTRVLETKGTNGENRNFIRAEKDKLEVWDNKGNLKLKIHSGTLASNSTSEATINYNTPTQSWATDVDTVKIALTNQFKAEAGNFSYDFSPAIGNIQYTPRKVDGINEVQGFPSITIEASLYYSEQASVSLNYMTKVADLGSYTYSWSGSEEARLHNIDFNIPLGKRTLTQGWYRVAVLIRDNYKHQNSTINMTGGSIIVTGVTQLQEIASNGYHYQYGTAETPKYQKASADKFEVVYGNHGLRISETYGIQYLKNGIWQKLI